MAQIEVAEKLAAELQQLAVQDARALEDVVAEPIQTYLSYRFHEPELAPSQMERMKHSFGQLDRGEIASQDEVEAFFDGWEKEAAAR